MFPRQDERERWRSRIVGHAELRPADITTHPLNWRTHPRAQHAALAGVLDEVGWVQQVIVNRRTGRLVDGHLRVEAARRRGEPTIPVLYVDLDESEEALVLATLLSDRFRPGAHGIRPLPEPRARYLRREDERHTLGGGIEGELARA